MAVQGIEALFEAELANNYGLVVADFEITQRPQGGAPERIRDMWIGVSLPVRENNLRDSSSQEPRLDVLTGNYNTIDHRVPVCGVEAVIALNSLGAAKAEAVGFFAQYMGGLFTFRGNEGILTLRSTGTA